MFRLSLRKTPENEVKLENIKSTLNFNVCDLIEN